MTQKIAIHRGREEFPNMLWWRPLFDWQRRINETIINAAYPFAPSALFNAEETVFENMQKNANRAFSAMFNNRQMFMPLWAGDQPGPHIDILENREGYTVKAEIPGMDAEGIDLSASRNALIISGEKKNGMKSGGETYLRHECGSGPFSRTVAVPDDADMNNAQASFDPHERALTVKIPKIGRPMEKRPRPKAPRRRRKQKAASHPAQHQRRAA